MKREKIIQNKKGSSYERSPFQFCQGRTMIAVLSQSGFEGAKVHMAENFISMSYGDLAMRINLVDQSKSVFFPLFTWIIQMVSRQAPLLYQILLPRRWWKLTGNIALTILSIATSFFLGQNNIVYRFWLGLQV